jgi:Ca-activated chloride channel family protein
LYGDYFESGASLPGDQYDTIRENQFVKTIETPVSTFSIDADGASYSNIKRYILEENTLPPQGAVRTEELINYFDMNYPFTSSTDPISLNGEVSSCPWAEGHRLVRIGLVGKPMAEHSRPPSNFVFLIDVSGSMKSSDKLDLLKQGFSEFTDHLRADDRVAIVTYHARQ